MNRVLRFTGCLLMLAAIAIASDPPQAPVTYHDDFQSYGKSKKPPGWIDGKVGDLKAKPRGYFKTAIDPLGDKKGSNIVFGTTKSTGGDDEEKRGNRIGYFSTYVDKTFSAAGRFEVQGRLVEMSSQSRFGLVVLSGYPDKDKYYLIGEKKTGEEGKSTIQLTAFGAGTPAGKVDSGLSINRARWYRFRISVDDANNATAIRARFWPDGTTEPATYQLDASDSSSSRLKTGHFGLWSGGRGDKEDDEPDEDESKGFYIDDVDAHSPSDVTPPVISFYESGTKLDPSTTPAFNHDAKIEIRVTDDLSTFTYSALLDGNAYASLTPVSAEGVHTLTVHAVDAPGNASDATLKFLVDKTPPVIVLIADGNPLIDGTIFKNDVTVNATIRDISAVKTTSTLDGTTVTLPLPVAQESNHRLVVNATDAANNPSSAAATFVVDKSAPVITIKANGTELAAGASFREDITLTWSATDLTLDKVTATLDGNAIQSGFAVTTEGLHTLVVTATDKATHSTTETRNFALDKHAPEVELLANGSAFVKDKTFNTAVKFTVVVHDSTPTTTVITVDNNPYTQGAPVTGDGLHSVKVVVTNAVGTSTTVGPFGFTIDTVPPTITMTESGQPFRDGMKFNRDVLPIVTATDALTPNPTIVVTLDGKPYPANTAINEEKADHVISATATDAGGNIAPIGPFHFMLDKSKPVVTIVNAATGQPFPPDALFNIAVAVKVTVADITKTTVVATLDAASFNLGSPSTQPDGTIVYTPSPISAEGAHALSVVATDEVGFSNDPASAHFVIDMTPPHITFTDPVPNSTVSSVMITVSGTADDAQTITIGGRAAAVNTAAKTFTISDVGLVEGRNEIPAVAVDAAGNRSAPSLVVFLDTRPPDLAITAPATDACVDATSLTVTGNAFDPNLDSVKVTVGDSAPVLATLDKTTGAWTATVPAGAEGKKLITVEAADLAAHSITASRSITIDRTAPSIDVRDSGTSFTAVRINRAVALFVRVTDADPAVVLTATLDGSAYASGTSIGTEGHHLLVVSATDCAGHRTDRTVDFTIDLTPPTIRNLDPANGSTVGAMPSAIKGSTDTDAVSVEVSGTQLRATPAADGTFIIASVPFAEGANHFNLIARDQAGNSSSLDYTVTVKTAAPNVEIRESGLPIASGTLYNRAVTPVIRSADPGATVSATLNAAPFTSGTTITADGDYRIAATATDRFSHAGTAETTFTIDRTPPIVKITSPASGTVQSDHVQVRGTAGDAVSASVNGQPVTLGADGSFVLDSLALDVGTNPIVATGRDRAGNTGRDEVSVTRDDLGAGILLTYPPDHSLTNRPTTDVIGRLLTPGRTTTVTIGSTSTPVDPTGGFRINGLALIEGENTITATSTAANGVQAAATTHVTADLTPPTLVILESGQPLTDAARFATQAVISLQATDTAGAVTTELTIDGTKTTTATFTITSIGGHSVIAKARDLAGNETRSERTLFIGTSSSGTSDCKLDSFDPANGAVILSNSTTLVGRSGGAIGVKVNGVAAVVADGAFVATVELPVEGPNNITIVCTDANGTPTGTPATLTLQRVTGDPSITIDTPQENFVSAQETIAVTGTVGPGVVSADVNGVAGTISGTDTTTTRPFTVPAVHLAPGLNVLTAHGRNAAARVATASRRGVFAKDAPAVSISAPSANATTGLPRVTVSGTYSNLDPTTLVVSNSGYPAQAPLPAQFVRASDTGGSFTAIDVPLTSGGQTLRVSGRDRLNREGAATVIVTLVSGAPSIAIAQPADHSYFAGGSDSVAVSGTFQAAAGATVDVNGTTATINGSSYSATAKFSTLAGGATPVVARVTEPAGASASAIVIVTQLIGAPTVIESFPAPNAVEVDNGALLLVLFSQPMDGASINAAFRLEDTSGTPVSGTMYLDKDVLTFAPATLLTTGGHYTMRVTTAAKNLAGTALAAEYTSSFTIATSAPSSAPAINPIASAVCGQSITVSGTATPGARVQLDSGTLTLNGSADGTGKFTFTYPISGQSGFALVRVRTVGSDGSLSPAAQLTVRIDCSGPSVLNAGYDRSVNKLTIQFSEPIDPASATTGSILLQLDDGRSVSGAISVAQSIATVTPAEDLTKRTFTLTVNNGVKDLVGNPLTAPFTQTFSTTGGDQPPPGHGAGFISGEVYDATTGRPLAGVAIAIDVATATPISTTTDARGRYLANVPEGAHTIKASAAGFTTVWRQIIVPAGAGVVPIDIRLTRRGDFTTANGSAIALTNGGDTAITKKVDLAVPAGALASGKLTLTSTGAQALTGLLPLGWSPLAAAEVNVDGSESATPLGGAQLTFNVPAADVAAAAQNLTAVEYDSVRDEWRVLTAVVNAGSDGKAIVPIARTGSFALVYADKRPGLVVPPLPVAGDVLRGVPAAAPDAPALVQHDFVLNPPVVVPSGRTVATLRIEGTGAATYPSGTAVQASIDEELQLADGSRLLDPPFATDLLLYRTLAGDLGVADFHLAPSTKAAQVVLEVGVDHIRVHPYPGRLDRGTLIGSEGGRVPADDKVAVDIPTGAVPEAVRATAASLTKSDLDAIGAIAGYRVVGGFQFTLQRANEPPPQDLNGDGVPDPVPPLELFVSARATFTVDRSQLPSPTAQVILGELLDQTLFGKMVRLAAPMMPVDSSQTSTTAVRFTTRPIDRSVLPVDGILHEGRYVVLAAEAPIAFATGTVHFGSATGRLASDARVITPSLGVAELSRATGIYNVPVPARPAAPFTLIPRHTSTGDGTAYVNPAVAEPDAVVHVDLALVAQPPVLSSVVVLKGAPPSQAALGGAITTDVALTTNVRASFTPSIDPASVNADSITVTDATTGVKVKGSAAADGSVAVVWTLNAGEKLKANTSYIVAVAGTIRGSNGASLVHGASFSIVTVTQILSTDVDRERIRITLPDANGVSRISGDAGALPAGWQAVAVRRGHDFIIRYQATAAADGSFSFSVGNGGDAADRVDLGDLIDLQVINSTGNLAAIFSLTPFVTEDGKGFVVPAGAAVRYTTPEGITLDVPAGAFDVPTVINVAAAKKEDFLEIPSLEAENEYIGSVRIDFNGEAKKPLVVETAVPTGFDTTGKQFILAQKGMSLRGPRLAVIDLMRVDHGKFTNSPDPNAGQQIFHIQGFKPGTNQTLTGSKFSKYLRMLLRSGIFMVLDIKQPVGGSVGWAVMEGLQASYDLTWDIFASYYIPHEAIVERGGALLPIITGRRFTVVGTDPGTGLQAFSRTYDPIPVGEPGTVVPIDSAQQNTGGPYPVFGSPFRVEILDLDVEAVDINSVRNFSVRLEGGTVRVSPGSSPLDGDRIVELLNVSNGTFTSGSASSMLSLSAKAGDRIVLLIEERDVDPSAPVSVVFNEPVYSGSSATPDAIDTYLHGLLKVEQAPEPVVTGTAPSFSDITSQVTFTTDSGGRRINVVLPSALQREAVYRVTLQPDIADVINSAPGLKLGQGTIDNGGTLTPAGGGNPLSLLFHVRKPAGPLGVFTAAPTGLISGMDLAGNVLFIAAQNGGLLAYDVSNPTALGTTSAPIASVPGQPNGIANTLAITIDRHNRIYTTAQAPIAGIFRSYRVEDFVAGGSPAQKASALISWKMGYSQMIGLPSNTVVSDRPESIPFRIKVLLQDDEQNFANRQEFVAGTGAARVADYPDDLQKFTLTIGKDGTPYNLQRITVENLSLDMRWSADAGAGPAVFSNIIARSTDKLRLLRNQKTFAVVAHLGYGLGIYDANAIESNRSLGLPTNAPGHIREQLILTAGKIDRDCPNKTPDYGIVENYLNTDAELRGDINGDIFAYAPDPYRGVLDLQLKLPSPTQDGTRDDTCDQRSTPNYGGLLVRSSPDGNATPRMAAVRSAFMGAAGREPFNHFTQVAQFHWSVTAAQNSKGLRGTRPNSDASRDYLLVSGTDYGLIVLDINSDPVSVPPYPLVDANVADVIWIPGSAVGVRVYQNANTAVVCDRFGRVLLVDLSRIDERWDDAGAPTSGLFPTARKALAGASTDPFGVGADDARIIWKSQPGVVSGTLAPVFDPNTGMVFAGAMSQRQVKILSAIDPRLQVKVNLGSAGGLSDVGGIVPLGIAPPANVQSQIDALPACDGTTLRCKENASLGAFRLEVALPGNMVDALTGSNNELQLAVESERVAGAITEQTPDGFPRAHLRRTRRDGSAEFPARVAGNFKFHRIVPDDLRNALKNQSGYNRFVSPWIIAIADPRASSKYEWNGASTQQKKDAGCESCDRPRHLLGLGESDGVYELWTNGRFVGVRPELTTSNRTIFDGTTYSYLGDLNRLAGRFSTIMADTVRPTEALVAGQNPPVAVGNLQQTTFLHSGELETNSVDLDAGGRAGFNVRFDRTYRSRTIGGSTFGQGWDSSMLRRLRALPNGDVEFRDGADVWRFRGIPSGGYDSPRGLFLKLSRTSRGWKIIDQQWRISEFDDLGRLLSETDEFFDLQTPGSGNVIRYVYDDTGRLSQIIDPVQRSSTLSYWKESDAGATGAYPGLVKEIGDWRDRKIDYLYDGAAGTLLKVQLPDVVNSSGNRPTVVYGYTPAGASYNDSIEIRSNLASITDPQEAASGGTPRVQFTYGTSGPARDHVLTQQWGTGENATFTYNSATAVDTTDTLGQTRKYTLSVQPKDAFNDRAHVLSMIETSVAVSSAAFGQLPSSISASTPATTSSDRNWSFSYDGEGLLTSNKLDGVRNTTYTYNSVQPEAPGFVPASSTTTDLGGGAPTITNAVTYQSGANRSTFVASVSANGQSIDAPEPSRNYKDVISSNDDIAAKDSFDSSGLLNKSQSSGGTDASSAGAERTMGYAAAGDAAKHKRAALTTIDAGGVKTDISYPSPAQSVQTDARGVVTTTDLDTWERPTHIAVVGPQMTMDDRLEYDATGRLLKHVRKQGGNDVTRTYQYDVMGRPTSISDDNVAGAGTVTTTIVYNLTNRTIITTHPGGSVTTTTLDTLGRVSSRQTTTGGSPVSDYLAYDLDGNIVFVTDTLTATAKAFDGHGRMVGIMASDGTRQTVTLDAWGRPTNVKTLDSTGGTAGESTLDYTTAGRLRSIDTKVDAAQNRVTSYAWDGGGRTTGTAESGRAGHAKYDSAGRLLSAQSGDGNALGVSTVFDGADISGHTGTLPQQGKKKEKSSSAYDLALEYNAAADVTTQDLGSLEWKHDFDQAGNVTSAKSPNRPAFSYQYDSRGSVTLEALPGGSMNRFEYHPTGALASYTDPANEITQTTNDLIGRPVVRSFKDGTTETIEWEGRRVKSITDRQNRLRSFVYNAKGQIAQITGSGGAVLDKIDYDNAGRIIRWTNDDAVIEYADFDFDGHPRKTTQSRYRNGALVDQYSQNHTWTVHGERDSWTMPTYAGFNSTKAWTSSVAIDRDAMGNVTKIQKTVVGGSGPSTLLDADYRNSLRPNQRKITTSAGQQIARDYGYDSNNGLLNRLAVTSNGVVVAGSEITYDGLQKSRSRLLGVSGGARADAWNYDERSRLLSSTLARDSGSTPEAESLSPADFRNALRRSPTTPVDPPSIVFTENPAGGHKISVMQRGLLVENFIFNGGDRREDGRFTYDYDAKGRLSVVSEKPGTATSLRRVRYFYDGNDRIVGRRAEYALIVLGVPPTPADWRLEDRADILAGDPLPPDSTFVWDPLDDELVAIFKAGASENAGIDANGGLVRQIINGQLVYDDPLEVTEPDSIAPSGVRHLYPIFDEAGAGSLQIVLNERGEVVSRAVLGGPFGEDQAVLAGPAVDKVFVSAKRDIGGNLVSIDVSIRATEQIAQTTVTGGFRLAAVDSNGKVVRTTSATASLRDDVTAHWTLTVDQWNALIDPTTGAPAALSIATTSSARGAAWSASSPFLPAPAWAVQSKPVYSSADLPVEVRESLAGISSWLASIPSGGERTNALYSIESLYALATPVFVINTGGAGAIDPQLFIVSAAFHAQPFGDPFTGKNFVRARWFDPETGTFLTVDPQGYRDSANLYAYCGNDPVNCSDPSGEARWPTGAEVKAFAWSAGKTIVVGVGVTVVATGVVALGIVSAPVVVTAGVVLAVGGAAYNGYKRYHAGQTDSVLKAGVMGLGDISGVNAGIEAIGGNEVGTGRKLSGVERADRAGTAFGTVVTIIAGPKVVKGTAKIVPAARTAVVSRLAPRPPTVPPVAAAAPAAEGAAAEVTNAVPKRPTWRASEISSGEELGEFGFQEQPSYINGEEVPYGTPGSVRPDYVSKGLKLSVDVKNYGISTSAGRSRLVSNIVSQVTKRATNLPPGVRQAIMIDARGQTVSDEMLERMISRIVQKTGGLISKDNIHVLR